jgi:hypothetical protein
MAPSRSNGLSQQSVALGWPSIDNGDMSLIRLNQSIINPNMITTITLESGSSCTVNFAGATTPSNKLNGSEMTRFAITSLSLECGMKRAGSVPLHLHQATRLQ